MRWNSSALRSWTTQKWLVACVVASTGAPVLAQAGVGFDLTWNTVDGGGIMWSVGGTYSLGGTIGQPDAALLPMTGGSFSLSGGFWQSLGPMCTSYAPADFDRDCDVDGDDLAAFVACVSGPTLGSLSGCSGKDLDHDTDVDQTDFGLFQRCYTGAGIPANPDCAN